MEGLGDKRDESSNSTMQLNQFQKDKFISAVPRGKSVSKQSLPHDRPPHLATPFQSN